MWPGAQLLLVLPPARLRCLGNKKWLGTLRRVFGRDGHRTGKHERGDAKKSMHGYSLIPYIRDDASKFRSRVKRFRAIENSRRASRTGRGDGLPVKIAVVANHLSSLRGNPEQGWLRRLDSALGVDFRCHTFCAGQRSVDFSASGKPSGSYERSF